VQQFVQNPCFRSAAIVQNPGYPQVGLYKVGVRRVVIEGELRIDFRDGAVRLGAGEMFVVSKGVEHKPCAERETKVMLIEPRGVPNTGDAGGERTAANDVWI
jgi:hypothetical protein